MKTIRLNIAIKPTQEVSEYVVQLSKELSKDRKTKVTLDGINILPHITIYSPVYPEKNVPQILNLLKELATNTKKYKAQFQSIHSNKGFILADYYKDKFWEMLHRKVLERMNPLREGTLRGKYKDQKYLNELPKEKQVNIDKYGYANVLGQWAPHLTIARFEDKDLADQLVEDMEWEIPELKVETLGLFEMGSSGTCVKLVKDFKLLS